MFGEVEVEQRRAARQGRVCGPRYTGHSHRFQGTMGDEAEEQQKAQALVNQLQVMKDEAQQIAQKISELDQERHEHSLVAETLDKLESDRKCFRCVLIAHPHQHILRHPFLPMSSRFDCQRGSIPEFSCNIVESLQSCPAHPSLLILS